MASLKLNKCTEWILTQKFYEMKFERISSAFVLFCVAIYSATGISLSLLHAAMHSSWVLVKYLSTYFYFLHKFQLDYLISEYIYRYAENSESIVCIGTVKYSNVSH